jgi:uncharacterized protein (DUF1778 family)
MGTRTERIEARIDPASAVRIRHASELTHTSLSGFMVAAASEKAESVIAEHAYTLVPNEYFDRLLAALDGPVEAMPKIETAAARQRERPTFKRV